MKLNKRKLFLCIAAIFIVYQWAGPQSEYVSAQVLHEVNKKDKVSFIVLGDWGVKGNYAQQQVAHQINFVAESKNIDFIVTAGDNFYPIGVESTDDAHWTDSYEQVYQGASLEIPWYPVLGNHDYGGNPKAQFEYSAHSKSWTFPGKYYALEQRFAGSKSLLMVFLDTNPFHDAYFEEERYKGIEAKDSTAQISWLEDLLEQSDADWKIVIGHHPLYTGGMRIREKPYVRKHLEKVFLKHKVDAYFAGHEHDLQHISPPGPTEYFVSGTGARVRPTGRIDHTKFSASAPGFVLVEVLSDRLKVDMIDQQGISIYETSLARQEKVPAFLRFFFD